MKHSATSHKKKRTVLTKKQRMAQVIRAGGLKAVKPRKGK